jgi:hypothetical protein
MLDENGSVWWLVDRNLGRSNASWRTPRLICRGDKRPDTTGSRFHSIPTLSLAQYSHGFFEMASRFIAIGLLYVAFQASATPSPALLRRDGPALLEERGLSRACQAVDDVLAVIAALDAPATSFCESFLDIGTSIVVSTISPATIDSTIVTVTTSVDVVTATTTLPPAKRWNNAPPPLVTPIPLRIFASNLLSTACSCLDLQPVVATSTTILATPVGYPLVHTLRWLC